MKHASQILARNILTLFEESSRSAKEVGQSSGVGQTTISGWIRKARESDPNFNPRIDQLEALARTFEHTVADLFTENLGRNKQEIVPPGAASPAGWGPSPAAKPAMAAHHPVGSALAHSAIGSHPNQAPSALVAAAMRLDVAPHVTQSTRDSLVALLNALASPR